MRRLHRSAPASEPSKSRSNFPSSPHGIAPGRAHGVVTVSEGRVPVPPPRGGTVPGLAEIELLGDGEPSVESVSEALGFGLGETSANVSFRSSSNAISERPTAMCGATMRRSAAITTTARSRVGSCDPRTTCAVAPRRHPPMTRFNSPSARSAPGVTKMMRSCVVPPTSVTKSATARRERSGAAKRAACRRLPRSQCPAPVSSVVNRAARTGERADRVRLGLAGFTPSSSLISGNCGEPSVVMREVVHALLPSLRQPWPPMRREPHPCADG